MEGDQPWTFVVATYFMQRYGNLIASVLWDVRSFVEFNNFIKTFPKKKGEPGTKGVREIRKKTRGQIFFKRHSGWTTYLLLRFLHYIVLFPILVFTSTSCWAILVHCYLFISFNYYLLLTQVQQCTVCLLMHSTHSTLTYAQPSCTVYKDIMDTHFQ